MSDKCNWPGESGAAYAYTVHELLWRPNAEQDGNYIFAKIVDDAWHAVYIGQGDLQDRYDAALSKGCVMLKSATHYHYHLNDDKDDREQEESDLIAGNPECKQPNGCNVQA